MVPFAFTRLPPRVAYGGGAWWGRKGRIPSNFPCLFVNSHYINCYNQVKIWPSVSCARGGGIFMRSSFLSGSLVLLVLLQGSDALRGQENGPRSNANRLTTFETSSGHGDDIAGLQRAAEAGDPLA